jgi:DNA-binding Lrp family transcriptional regulator
MKPFIRLSENERLFIAAAALSAVTSAKEIASRMGVREHQVRRIRDSLIQREILKPIYLIDTYRLGFTDFRVFLAGITSPSKIRSAFEKRALSYPSVYWLAKMSGSYQYALTFLAKDATDMISFFPAMQPSPIGINAHKTIAIAGDWTIYSPNYLAPGYKHRDCHHLTCKERIPPLDRQDILILETLSRNPAIHTAGLARLTGIPVTSLSYRLEKLTELKVVRGQFYLFNNSLIGISAFRITIVEKGLSPSQRERLRRYMSHHPNVCAILTCAGSFDFEVRFECGDPEEVEDFVQNIVDTFGEELGAIEVSQQLRILKRIAYPCSPTINT